jgi:hypothetical protein
VPSSTGLSRLDEPVEMATRTEPSTLYAATSHVGVYCTTAGGTSWRGDDGQAVDGAP